MLPELPDKDHPTAESVLVTSACVEAGELLDGKFRLLEPLGQGGQTSVWRAEHADMQRQIAIKFLHAHKCHDPKAVARFLQEARALTSLKHPGVIEVYAAGASPEGIPYLVMELAAGENLAKILKEQGPLPLTRAKAIFLAIADALSFAHANGIIHRDIKPDNVMVAGLDTDTPQVKLIDFGLVKLLSDSFPDRQSLTRTGLVLGSCQYMSPEQCTGAAIDARSDIYSLGCLMYEVLSGQTAFAADSPLATLNQHLNQTVPPVNGHDATRNLPLYMVQIIHQCLEKDRLLRQTSIQRLQQQLQDKQVQVDLARRFKLKGTRRLGFVAAALVLCCLLLSGLCFFQWRYNRRDDEAKAMSAASLVPEHIVKPDQALRRCEELLVAHTRSARLKAIAVLKAGVALSPIHSSNPKTMFTTACLKTRLGALCCLDGKRQEGLEYLIQAIALMEKCLDDNPVRQQYYVQARNQLAAYIEPGNAERVDLETLQKAATWNVDILGTHFNLAETRRKLANSSPPDQARHYLELAREHWQYILNNCQTGNEFANVAQAYVGLGQCEFRLAQLATTKPAAAKHYNLALTYLEKAFAPKPDGENYYWASQIEAIRILGSIYAYRQQPSAARQAFERIYDVPEHQRETNPWETTSCLTDYQTFLQRQGESDQKVRAEIERYRTLGAR